MSPGRLFTRNVDPDLLPVRWMPAWLMRLCSLRRRRLGLYDDATLHLVRHAWQRRPTAKNLLTYVRVARDLGHPLGAEQAGELVAHLQRLPSTALSQALNLLIEQGHFERDGCPVALDVLKARAETSPPIAHAVVVAGGTVSEQAQALAGMHTNQHRWQDDFGAYLQQPNHSVCVVGNAGNLVGSELGEKIDAHRVVVRFNRYRSESSRALDIGVRTDVWVRAPDLAESDGRAPWVMLNGPDVRYRLADWTHVTPLLQQGARVITAPLPLWRRLVEELRAPPSSGVLFLAMAIERLGSAQAVTAVGFQGLDASEPPTRYHQALPKHQPSNRHHWAAERALLRRWQEHGLTVLS